MGEYAQEDEKAELRKSGATTQASPAKAPLDRVLRSYSDEMVREIGDVAKPGPATPAAHREGLKGQILKLPDLMLRAVDNGIDSGIAALSRPERLKNSPSIMPLLAFAASSALGGAASSIAMILAQRIADRATQKFVEGALKDAIKKGFSLGSSTAVAPATKTDLVDAFADQLRSTATEIGYALSASYSDFYDLLSQVPDEELGALAARLTERQRARSGEVMHGVATQTMIAWSNFIARAHHGAMAGWDPWATHGSKNAIPLNSASAPQGGLGAQNQSVAGNIDPMNATSILDNSRGAALTPQRGLLEIHVDARGVVSTALGPAMQLHDVGPKVRERLRTLGFVRDLPVNKVVRVIGPIPDGTLAPRQSILITADGYIRAAALGSQSRVVMQPNESAGPAQRRETQECLNGLAAGHETGDCYWDSVGNQAMAAQIAERAQALPLSFMEE